MEGGNGFLSPQFSTIGNKKKSKSQKENIPVQTILPHTSAALSTVTSSSHTGAYSSRKKSSGAKRLWAYSGFSGDYCCERVCGSLCAREKVGQGKRDGQP